MKIAVSSPADNGCGGACRLKSVKTPLELSDLRDGITTKTDGAIFDAIVALRSSNSTNWQMGVEISVSSPMQESAASGIVPDWRWSDSAPVCRSYVYSSIKNEETFIFAQVEVEGEQRFMGLFSVAGAAAAQSRAISSWLAY